MDRMRSILDRMRSGPRWAVGLRRFSGAGGDAVLSCALLWSQERLKATEQRADMEEKVTKRSLDSAKSGLPSSAPGLVHRKPPVLSPSASASYSKAVSPPPLSPRASPVSVLKAEVIQKMEEPPSQPAYSYPATPSSHPASPPPASPPPAPAIPPKEEAPETVEKKDLELEKEAAGPFQALFPGKRALLLAESRCVCACLPFSPRLFPASTPSP